MRMIECQFFGVDLIFHFQIKLGMAYEGRGGQETSDDHAVST